MVRLICVDLRTVLDMSVTRVVEFNAFVNQLGDPHDLPHSPIHSNYVKLTTTSYQWKLTNVNPSFPVVCQSREYCAKHLLWKSVCSTCWSVCLSVRLSVCRH